LLQVFAVNAQSVTKIAAGGGHSLFLKSDGSLWVMGFNKCGQLGDGTTNNISSPKQIVPTGVVAIAAGSRHSLFLKSDGSLWAMGNDEYDQLGDDAPTYTKVEFDKFGHGTYVYFPATNRPEMIVKTDVTAIAAGSFHSLFIKKGGSLWVMGWNSGGQLGDGTRKDSPTPEQIVDSGVTAIAAGGSHSLFVKSDGSLWGMGKSEYGELGYDTFSFKRPVRIVSDGVTAIAASDHSLFLNNTRLSVMRYYQSAFCTTDIFPPGESA
jgi:alpha-tubulin suppressor-like RCC1 family protein